MIGDTHNIPTDSWQRMSWVARKRYLELNAPPRPVDRVKAPRETADTPLTDGPVMTMRQRVEDAQHAHPDWGTEKLADHLGCVRGTFWYHLQRIEAGK